MKAPSPQLLAFLRRWEGCRLEAYECEGSPRLLPSGKRERFFTIGYGHAGPEVYERQVISQKEAERLLLLDTQHVVDGVERLCPDWLNVNQRDAMASFAFNLGLKRLKDSTMLVRLREHDIVAAMLELQRWTRANGKVSAGLVLRRQAERELFMKPVLRVV